MTHYSNSSGFLYLHLYVDQVSQDVTSNSSKVKWRATLDREGAVRTLTYGKISRLQVWLNGAYVYDSYLDFETSGEEFTLASGEITVPHDSDGTKTIDVWASFDPNSGFHGNITISNKYTLNNIPRSSGILAFEGDRNLGSTHTIVLNRKGDSFTHQVWYRVFGSDWIDLGKNYRSRVTFTPSLDLARRLPKSRSGTLDICIRTYNGSTQVGSDLYSNGWAFNIPDTVRPILSGISLTDTTTSTRPVLAGNEFLQILSNIQVNFGNASGIYGSTIQTFHAEIVGKNQVVNENGGKLGIMNFNGPATVRAWVEDTRGIKSVVEEIPIKVIEYFGPSINFSVQRTRQNPSTLQVLRNAKIAPVVVNGSQKNFMKITFSVAPLNSTNFVEDRGEASATFTTLSLLTNSSANLTGNYPPDKSYVVKAKIEDRFTSTEFVATAATESVILHYDKDGRLGVGKIVEQGKPGSIDAKGDIYANGNLNAKGQVLVNGNPVQHFPITNPDGSVGRGSAQWDAPWDLQRTEFGWRNGRYADNPTGQGGHWGLLRNFWVDSWKIVQIFTSMSTGRTFLRTSDSTRGFNPKPWKEFMFKDDIKGPTWRKIVLQGGWNHYSKYSDAYICKTMEGVVYLKGNIWKGGTEKETVIAVLDPEFRPRSAVYLQALNNDYGVAVLLLNTDGRLVVKSNVDNKWLNLDNISFVI